MRISTGLFGWTGLRLCLVFVAGAAALVLSVPAEAQLDEVREVATGIDRVVEQFQRQAGSWQAQLNAYAKTLFWSIAVIEFAWACIRLALDGREMDDWVAMLTQQVFFIGTFWMLLQWGPALAHIVVQSFAEAAGAVSSSGDAAMRPSEVLSQGMVVVGKMAEQIDLFRVDLWLVAVVVIVCYALIAGVMVMVLVECYLILGAGMLVLGFGSSRWTSEKAMAIVNFTFGIGGKYFVLLLLVDLGLDVIGGIVESVPMNIEGTVLIIGCVVILLAMVSSIPEMMQSMLGGHSSQSGQNLMAAVRTASHAASTAANIASPSNIGNMATKAAGAASLMGAVGGAAKAGFNAAKEGDSSTLGALGKGAGAAFKGLAGAASEAAKHSTGSGRAAEYMKAPGAAGKVVEAAKGGVSGETA